MASSCNCEFPGSCACCRSPEQAGFIIVSEDPLIRVANPLPEETWEEAMAFMSSEPIEPQCDLENPEVCESCQ